MQARRGAVGLMAPTAHRSGFQLHLPPLLFALIEKSFFRGNFQLVDKSWLGKEKAKHIFCAENWNLYNRSIINECDLCEAEGPNHNGADNGGGIPGFCINVEPLIVFN